METIYTAKGKNKGYEYIFKFGLNGNLIEFKKDDITLSEDQENWLRKSIPMTISQMKIWMNTPYFKSRFDVNISPPDLSFEALWQLYGYKESRKDAEKSFAKLKEADIIKCFIQIPKYKKKIATTGVAQAMLATWLNKQRFNDEY